MPEIDVSEIISDPDFAQKYIVYRKTGDWVRGRFEENETPIPFYGAVTLGGTKDIIQVPEGDRTSQVMVFHSTQEIFVTHVDEQTPENSGTSDQAEWNGNRYRICKVAPWRDFGYYRAIGVSI